MPSYIGGMSACDARSDLAARRRKVIDLFLQSPQPLPLLEKAFGCEVVPPLPSVKWNYKHCLRLLLFVLYCCALVTAKHQGSIVSAAFQEPGFALNQEAAFPALRTKFTRTTGVTSLPSKGQRWASWEAEVEGGTPEEREERRSHPLPPPVTAGSLEGTEEHNDPIESDTSLQDANLEAASPEASGTLFIGQKPSMHGNTASPDSTGAVRVNPKVSLLVVTKIPSFSLPSSHASSKAAAIPSAHLRRPPSGSAGEKFTSYTPAADSSSHTEHAVAPPPQESTSSFNFSLQDELPFPSDLLLSPLRAAFAPSTPLAEKATALASPPEDFGRLTPENKQQKPSEGHQQDIPVAVELLRTSRRWTNGFAEDIQSRVAGFAPRNSGDNLVNKDLLLLVGNTQRSFAAKDDVAHEVDENKGDVPTSGADPARKVKKALPPFDKQTRKHMFYVREWFAVSVGATMNGMRDQDEDALVVSAALENFPNARMFSLFDGHAGPEAARRCSANASRIFGQLNGLTPPALKQACLDLDERIRVIAIAKALDSPTGTLFDLHLANVGDSRAFLLHMADNTYEILTRDHKPNQVEELQRIQKAGGCVRRIHKRVWRVNGFLALSRSFGDFALKRAASKTPEEQQVTAVPGTSTATARPGDYLLLGCDGVFEGEGMSWDFVARLLKESIEFFNGDIASIVNHLIDIAFALGSRDNISILLIKFTNKRLTPHVKRFEIEVDGTSRELPVEIITGQEVSTSTAGVYRRDHSLLVTLFS